jgi:thiosulfate/3-mercaptopyruvate sulfurtransferase
MISVFIEPKDASELQKQEKAIFIDCRHQLADTEYGRNEYQQEHIRGARFAHLDEDLSGDIREDTGRHPLPIILEFKEFLSDNAIDPRQTIIVYDDVGGGMAARLWWMLKQLGYPEVRILHGGWQTWKEYGGTTSSGTETIEPLKIELEARSWNDGYYDVYTIETISDGVYLVDSRAPERYEGKEEPIDLIPGRIPGSFNVFWGSHLDQKNQLKPKDEIRKKFGEAIDQDLPVVYYCGSGVTSCFNLAVLEELGLQADGLYPGSYSEFSRLQPHNIERDN